MVRKATTTEGATPDTTPQAGDDVTNGGHGHDAPKAPEALEAPGASPPYVPTGLTDVLAARIDSISQMQAEMARFGASRMHHALKARTKMMCCRSLGEMQAVQAAYVREMVETYAQEWGRLMTYGMRAGLGQPMPPPEAPFTECRATPV